MRTDCVLKWLGLLAVYKARLFFYSLTGLSSVLFSWICFSFSCLKVCGGGGVGQGSVKLFSSKLTLVILSINPSIHLSCISMTGNFVMCKENCKEEARKYAFLLRILVVNVLSATMAEMPSRSFSGWWPLDVELEQGNRSSCQIPFLETAHFMQ